MIIDAVVVVLLLVAIWVGFQQGVVRPLLVEIFFLLSLVIIVRDRVAYESAMQHYLHANVILSVFLALIVAVVAGFVGGQLGGLIHRMPVIRGVDGFLGIFVHAAVVVVVVYVALSVLVSLEKAFAPTLTAAGMSTKQVQTMTSNLLGNPLTAMLVDQNDLKRLQTQAAKPGSAAHIETVPQLDQLQTFYEQFIEPQLASSRTAPMIMRIGQRIPVIGHDGPADLPQPASPSRLNPSPSPKATASPKK